MRYTDFSGEFLRYLYRDSVNGGDFISFSDLAENNEIPYEPGFLVRLHRELKDGGHLTGPHLVAGDSTAVGSLTGSGLRHIESMYKDDLPEGPSEWREIRRMPTLGSEIDTVPASDRLVSLTHNSPEYKLVSDGLRDISEAVRSCNDISGRERILATLTAAESLWSSVELKALQIKVGVMMAIEDAGAALVGTAKAVATNLLIDAIKSLVKKAGIDLDHL